MNLIAGIKLGLALTFVLVLVSLAVGFRYWLGEAQAAREGWAQARNDVNGENGWRAQLAACNRARRDAVAQGGRDYETSERDLLAQCRSLVGVRDDEDFGAAINAGRYVPPVRSGVPSGGASSSGRP